MPFRYSRWDGTQQINPFDADELMEALADDLMEYGDLRSALQRLYRWGDEGRLTDRLEGLQQLLEKLRQQRQEELNRHNLSSVMDQIKQRLDEIVQMEREGIRRRLDETGRRPDQSSRSGQTGPQGEPGQAGQSSQQGQAGQQGQSGQAGQSGQRGQSGQMGQAGQRGQMGMRAPSGQPGQSGQRGGAGQPGQPGQRGQAGEGGESGEQAPLTAENIQRMREMLENIAQKKLATLDELPRDPGSQIKALQEYDFMDDEAREAFQALLESLKREVMQSYFQGMKDAIQQMTPEDMQRLREMVRDLNQMIQQKLQGQEPDFNSFKQKYGDMFPGVNSFDELMDHMFRQMAQMQSLLNSMSADQRQQLQQMMDSVLQDDRLKWDLAQLGAGLQQLFPDRRFGARYPFRGDQPLSLMEAMGMMERLQGLDELERQLKSAHNFSNLDRVDVDKLRELLGDDSARALEQLQQIAKLLEEAGYIRRTGDKLELTPQGVRRIGQKALRDIFAQLRKDNFGRHEASLRGGGGDRTEESKPYEFGDSFYLDIQKTVMNAVTRHGAGTPVRVTPPDFEVYRTELLTTASTVLMLDMSRSMLLRGCFLAAKKVALALNSLIRGQYPKDNLYIVGFSYTANQLEAEALPELDWDEYVYGTNMQHGFMLSRQLLSRHKGGTRQIIVITDGEPTAHFEGGRVQFNYPPTYRTIQETLREVVRCTRENITINTFMLERSPYLTDFVNQVTKINRGRAFFASPERLGEYILVDYVSNKRKRIA